MGDTIFTKVDFTLSSLMEAVELGDIGLPDIQRPFVWGNAKVRNLFDSMYRGYPVGYLLFWESGAADGTRSIGVGKKQVVPLRLIVDGQQRLTSLFAVVKGVPVIRENYEAEPIEIAFSPVDEKFAVANAATRRDKTFIPNISVIWDKKTNIYEFIGKFLSDLGETRELSQEETHKASEAINNLHNLLHFPFTSLQLASSVDEEQVSEVFVRINSEGKKLNQSDFILTLMSVFWDEGRAQLEQFCREARVPSTGTASPFNHFIRPDPDQLLRVGIGLGFRRARLSTVYSILRGKDLESEKVSSERREKQFDVLKQAQERVLNLQYWHDFLKALMLAGYRSEKMISSQNALLFAYTLYLLGRTEYNIDEQTLRRLIAQWFFMSAMTGRYASSPESTMEFDLARLRQIGSGDEFVTTLHGVCEETLTHDFWKIGLPNELATAAAISPSMFAYFASLNLLDARVLFSKLKVSELMDPTTDAKRKSLERHHLFPRNYLKSLKITDNRDINQIANFTVVEWGDNAKIADKPPHEYLPELTELSKLSASELEQMTYWHALPPDWENMEYGEFLKKRRELMSEVISDAYKKLTEGVGAEPADRPAIRVEDLVDKGETSTIEFKSTLRINLHTGEKDPRMVLAILRTIAGFLNKSGGILVVGASDDGTPVGIEADKFENEDKMSLHLANLINDRIGAQHSLYIHPRFDDYEDVRVLVVECMGGKTPVFVKDGDTERFYIRTGTSTSELSASQTQEYIKHRFK